jgi:hypothetical protein
MAEKLPPKITVEDTKAQSLEINEAYVDTVDVDDFDDVLVEGDVGYIDPDLDGSLAGLELPIDTTGTGFYPVPTIDLTSVTKTRRVLATGEVVYDIKFDVSDVGATKYEVIWAKQ